MLNKDEEHMVIYVYSYNFSVGLKFLKIKSWGNKNKAQNCLYVNTILAFSKITCVCVYMQNLKEWKEIFMYEWQKLLLSSKHFVLFSKVSANEQVFINKNLIFLCLFWRKKDDEEETIDRSLLPLSSYNLWVSTKWKKILSLGKA